MTKKKEIGLVYTGAGMGAFFAGIPARDLTPVEVEKYGGEAFILALGLYEKPAPVKEK